MTTLGLDEAAALMRVHPDTARKMAKAGGVVTIHG